MSGSDSIAALLGVPAVAAALLAVLPGYRLTARLNVLAAFLTLLAAASLYVVPRPPAGPYLFVDDLNVVFVVLILGYGTKVGLAPLHAWLPDAHAEGPTPISAVLSGLLLNVALYAVLRFKLLLAANPGAIAPGPLMITLGLGSLLFAGFMLYRRRDI